MCLTLSLAFLAKSRQPLAMRETDQRDQQANITDSANREHGNPNMHIPLVTTVSHNGRTEKCERGQQNQRADRKYAQDH